MDLSEEWKSLFPIGSVFSAPLLLSSKTLFGPLFFNPLHQTLTLLFNSPSLCPPLLNPPPRVTLPRFLSTSTTSLSPVPLSAASSIASSFGPQYQNDAASSSLLAHNRLQFLRCPKLPNTFIVFFPTGSNHDQVGFLLLSVKQKSLDAVGDQTGIPFTASKCLNQRILRILVNPCFDGTPYSSSANIFGYLLVYTMYSAHWFCVKFSEILKRPVLGYMGFKIFKSCSVVGACWSPHLPKESVVLLENGNLYFFDLESECSNVCFKGTRLKVSWDDWGNSGHCKWVGCEFSWHPQILIVSRSDAVFLVDWRYDDQCNITCLANIDMLSMYALSEERFIAFSKVVSDHFHFVLVSDTLLVLCDVRKPLMPVLQWAHRLYKPCHVNVFRLSNLRSNSRDNTYEWATASGFVIILSSFWNCEFRLFCYGPPPPGRKGSIASEISRFARSVYAWELPSDLLLSGHDCWCGSCLVREEILRDSLPEWVDWQQKKDMVLGFGILSNDLFSLLFEPDEYGGFALIRLMSSGRLESQRYCASWSLVKKQESAHRAPPLCFEGNLLYSNGNEEYKFPRKFKYLELEYLCAYLNGDLCQVLHSSMTKQCTDLPKNEYFSLDIHEILCEKLKICGLNRFRTSPAISVVFNDINLPTSIYEVALRGLWTSLPMELLQLAFSSYSKCLDVLLDRKKVALEFLVVPDLPQLPPFLLRKPSSCSNRWSSKVQDSDVFVGPVLPLPVLVALHEFHNGSPNSQEVSRFSPEMELNSQCNEVMQVAREISVSDSTSEPGDENAVSLGDDRDEVHVDSKKPKPFLLYHPVAGQSSVMGQRVENPICKDDRFGSLISKLQKNEPTNNSDKGEGIGELFDDLCLIDLKCDDTGASSFSSQELKAYKLLKKHFSKWQQELNWYQEFCTRFQQKQDA